MSTSKFAARRRGFTLIELLIVIVVIAILSLIVIPKLMGASRKAKDSTLRANLTILRNAIAQYEADCGSYPPNNSLLGLITQPGSLANGVWKGPYLKNEGAVVEGGIPANPYATTAQDTAAEQWLYESANGTVKPAADCPGGNDASTPSKAYSAY